MNIFFLAPNNYDFTKVIVEELQREGHSVYLAEDRQFKYDPYLSPNNSIKSMLKRLLWSKKKKREYIRKILAEYTQSADLFLCINGYSYDKTLIKELKKRNGKLRSIYYLWDSCGYVSGIWHDANFEH